MRPSGDLGHIDQNGRLFYDGRCDRQVKRLGHRINLDHIQQVQCWYSAFMYLYMHDVTTDTGESKKIIVYNNY